MVYRHLQQSHQAADKRILLVSTFFAFTAGHLNALFLFLHAIMVSHQTGNLSHVGSVALLQDWSVVAVPLIVLGSFFCGAVFSGAVLGDATFDPHRKYGTLTVIEGALLLCAALTGQTYYLATLIVGSFAMGLQNAFISSYHGIIIRTTHMTGIVTDLGFLVGSALKCRTWQFGKMAFFLSILAGFTAGAGSGYWCASVWQFRSLFVLAPIFIGSGLYYSRKELQE